MSRKARLVDGKERPYLTQARLTLGDEAKDRDADGMSQRLSNLGHKRIKRRGHGFPVDGFLHHDAVLYSFGRS
jgi:hypothetical protein